jgi:hypothetical protein
LKYLKCRYGYTDTDTNFTCTARGYTIYIRWKADKMYSGSADGREEESMIREHINRQRSASHGKGYKRGAQKRRVAKLSGLKQHRAVIGTLRIQGRIIGRGGQRESKVGGEGFHRSVPYSDLSD